MLYTFPENDIQIVKFSISIPAGRIAEYTKLQSFITAKLLMKGTVNHNAEYIVEQFDYYGATVEIEAGYDEVIISLFCIKKHFESLIALFKELVFEAIFPQSEFDLFIKIRIEKLKQALSKNESVAERKLGIALFGNDHPYGYVSEVEDYQNFKIDDTINFYRQNYKSDLANYTLVGDFDDRILELINQLFDVRNSNIFPTKNSFEIKASAVKHQVYTLPNPYQSSIRIGWHTIAPNHPDYCGLTVLNVLLGGYFGSRLMTNIREDKGYTYGIYSQIFAQQYATYGYIATETDKKNVANVIEEVKVEFDKLRNDKILDPELNLLKNYMKGDILRDLDGSFKIADAQSRMRKFELGDDYFTQLLKVVNEINAEDLQNLAMKYLNFDDCYIITV